MRSRAKKRIVCANGIPGVITKIERWCSTPSAERVEERLSSCTVEFPSPASLGKFLAPLSVLTSLPAAVHRWPKPVRCDRVEQLMRRLERVLTPGHDVFEATRQRAGLCIVAQLQYVRAAAWVFRFLAQTHCDVLVVELCGSVAPAAGRVVRERSAFGRNREAHVEARTYVGPIDAPITL
jgi:hypothetical protein